MLKKLEVLALRGATQKFTLDFERGKKITIIYGENGSGKSTICDAVELLANGKLGSLDGKGLGKTESFWPSTGYQPSDVTVTLATTKGTWTAGIAKSKVTVAPPTDRPRAAVLRRSQILGLIAQQPKNRFDAIRPFLDIETVEQSEAHLKKLIEQEQANSRMAIARIDENRVAVENFWQEAGSPGASALSWARQELLRDTKDLEQEVEGLEAFIDAAEKTAEERDRLAGNAQEQEKAASALAETEARVEQEEAHVSSAASELADVLTAANQYFHRHVSPDACPLCGSSQFAAGLPERVKIQLGNISALTQAKAQRGDAEGTLTTARTLVERQQKAFWGRAVRLAQVVATEAPLQAVDYPSPLVAAASACLTCSEEGRPLAADALADQVSSFVTAVKAVRDERRKQLGFAQTLRRAVENYDANYTAQAELELLN